MRYWILAGLCALGFGQLPPVAQAQSQSEAHKALTPERVFSDLDLSGPKVVGAKLSPDGSLLTYLKPKLSNAMVQDLWAVPTLGGAPYVLVDADRLSSAVKVLSEAEKSRRERMRVSARGVVAYEWDENGHDILVPLDGDIYRVEAKSGAVVRLTNTPEDEVDAKLSPGGTQIAFVRSGQVIVKSITDGAEKAISPLAGPNLTYGTAEFIAQEELGRYSGYWWSPKGDKIAYQRTDESDVDIIPRLEVGADSMRIVDQRYPRAGRPNAKVELFVQGLNGGGAVRMDLGNNPDIYLARVNWSKDGKILYAQRLSRNQKQLDLIAFEPSSGRGHIILSETSDTWINLNDDFRLLKDGSFIWASERDGNKHLYLYDKSGQLIRQITKGDWPVDHLAALDEARDRLYFEASQDTPIEHGLYVTGLKKFGDVKALTRSGGWWTTSASENGKAFIGTYSDPLTPPQTALYDSDGKRLSWIEENHLGENHPYFPDKDRYPPPEFGTLKAADGQVMPWLMLKPKDFDPSKKYPVIVSIYGGPANALVKRNWVTPSTRLFQEAGFIVFTLDNRGTPGRSVTFGRSIFKRFGGPDIDDQVQGAQWLQSLSYVDGLHIGIMGWSQGGFVTLMALTVKDSPFVAGAAGAPPTQWGLYDTAYTERYMSTPQDNPEGYRASDVLNRLDNLKAGSLLLMHGLSDDNVLIANTTRVMTALEQKSVPFELMLYPGERHGVRGNAKNLQRYRLYLDFFTRKLKPEGASPN